MVAWRSIIEEIDDLESGYLVCVSGGLDSMYLLDFFARHASSRMRVAHFNHGLRPAADSEQALVERKCSELGIEVIVGHGDPAAMRAASSLEEEARRQRYAFFESMVGEGELVVTAHHADDQLETVLLRLMRGVPEGSLRMRRLDGRRYKPFLAVTRSELETSAPFRGIEYIEDESNSDLRHERNWVRHVIVPEMKTRRNVLKSVALSVNDGPQKLTTSIKLR